MCPSGPEASILLPFGHAVARRGCTPIPRRAIYCGQYKVEEPPLYWCTPMEPLSQKDIMGENLFGALFRKPTVENIDYSKVILS